MIELPVMTLVFSGVLVLFFGFILGGLFQATVAYRRASNRDAIRVKIEGLREIYREKGDV